MMQRPRSRTGRAAGFTLIEALIVVALLALMLVVALPNFQRMRVKAQTWGAIRTWTSMLDLARSEALKSHQPVVVAYDAGSRTFTAWHDWDPGGANVTTNGDQVLNGNERAIQVDRLDPIINGVSSIPLIYAHDGSLASPAAGTTSTISDHKGNVFRIDIIGVTGQHRVLGKDGDGTFTRKQETWVWNY